MVPAGAGGPAQPRPSPFLLLSQVRTSFQWQWEPVLTVSHFSPWGLSQMHGSSQGPPHILAPFADLGPVQAWCIGLSGPGTMHTT
jgi:hypothetical protein